MKWSKMVQLKVSDTLTELKLTAIVQAIKGDGCRIEWLLQQFNDWTDAVKQQLF